MQQYIIRALMRVFLVLGSIFVHEKMLLFESGSAFNSVGRLFELIRNSPSYSYQENFIVFQLIA